ncbi:hypothetical protein RJT34_31370 [Clitoria ternatea]|uniref:Uncharacterized protein n=1 Tax=Clitoria ternatea TaxID=43366 RepID=A0AAN9EVE8_CLITE
MNTKPSHGPIHFRALSKLFWHTFRGMIPHKTKREEATLARLKVFEGIPAPYDKTKRMVVPDALKVLRLQKGHKFCLLGKLSSEKRSIAWTNANDKGEVLSSLIFLMSKIPFSPGYEFSNLVVDDGIKVFESRSLSKHVQGQCWWKTIDVGRERERGKREEE